MDDHHYGALLEELRSHFELLAEGQSLLRQQMGEMRAELVSRMDQTIEILGASARESNRRIESLEEGQQRLDRGQERVGELEQRIEGHLASHGR